jgi:hypothetical protein
VIAGHVAGVPVEELAPFAGCGVAMFIARAWLAVFLRKCTIR